MRGGRNKEDSLLSHHDVEPLPSGNVLVIVWEAISDTEAFALGRTSTEDETLWADAIYEICRESASNNCTDGDIFWSWHSWDHVVQDEDNSVASTCVADVSEHPNKIDLNYYKGSGKADWTHFNSIDYDEETGHILISVHGFSEYWIIDYNDPDAGILTQVGNPAAYGAEGEQTLYSQHDAQWIEEGLDGAGNILVFNNGVNRDGGSYSSVD